MFKETLKVLVGILILNLSIFGAYASDKTFSMTEVKVVDQDTLTISFNEDLLEDVSMFEFQLDSKTDETMVYSLDGITLLSPKELKINSMTPLNANEEYNLVVVFASDKEGNVIENGVDGMVTFTTPEIFPTEENNVDLDLNAAGEGPADGVVVNDTVSGENAQTVEIAANDTESLPETGPKEMMFIVLAMLLGLGVMYMRKKA